MPELPEVETVCRDLAPKVVGRRLLAINTPVGYSRALVSPELVEKMQGQQVLSVARRAKYILWELENGLIAFHLRMTGRLLCEAPEQLKYVTVWIDFVDGGTVWFHDVRKFGKVYCYASREAFESDKHLGYEPLVETFTAAKLDQLITSSSRKIKPFLLDQHLLVGLGNIYADEVLWASKIHPEQASNSISKSKIRALHSAIVEVLTASIELNGTTFLNFYFDGDSRGNYASLLKVFGRAGQPCLRCGTSIEKLRVAQRGTHICPRCQRR